MLHPIDVETAKTVGQMCAELGHADIVDVHVAMLALRYRTAVLTSDPGDMAALGIPGPAIN